MLKHGDVIGNYRILRPLGGGGFAEVFEAEDTILQRRVALKILQADLARHSDVVARFEREVRAVATLDHPGIVPIYSVGSQDRLHFYSMRLLSGGDLRQLMSATMRPTHALAILAALASALGHAHAHGVIHRDVKPENILFDDKERPLLTDFGIARTLRSESRLTAAGMAVGTPRYVSPEQARGADVDARADLYGLGVLLFEMLAGRPPYDAADPLSIVLMHVTEPIPQLPAEHAALQALVERLMAKHPAERFGSAEELIGALRSQLKGYHVAPNQSLPIGGPGPAPAPAPSMLETSAGMTPWPMPLASETPPAPPFLDAPEIRPARSGKRFAAGAAGVLLLVSAVLIWQYLGQDDDSEPSSSPYVIAAPTEPTLTRAPLQAAERTEQIAREKRRCAMHVSTLTPAGDLVYDDAHELPGATQARDGSGIRLPKLRLSSGQLVNALITPQGCVLIMGMATEARSEARSEELP